MANRYEGADLVNAVLKHQMTIGGTVAACDLAIEIISSAAAILAHEAGKERAIEVLRMAEEVIIKHEMEEIEWQK